MIKVKGGLMGVLALFGERPILLIVPLAILPALATATVATLLDVDAGLMPDVLFFLGLTAMAAMALKDKAGLANPFVGPARRNLDALRERAGPDGTLLLTVSVDGPVVLRVVVPDPAGIAAPGRRDEGFACPILVLSRDGDGRWTHAPATAGVDAFGSMRINFELDGKTASVEARVDCVKDFRITDGSRGKGLEPAGVTPRAAGALVGADLGSRKGIDRARREAAKRLHPDVAAKGDADLLGEVNAALDVYERRLSA